MNKLSLTLCTALLFSGCKTEVIHDLTEREANQLLAVLSENGISSQKSRQPEGKWTLLTNSEEVVQAVRVIEHSRVLRASTSQVNSNSSSLIQTPDEQRFFYERSLSESIESSLARIDGVLEARVHLSIPPRDPFFHVEETNGGKGSVVLTVQEGFPYKREDIAAVVEGATSIKQEHITVLIHQQVNHSPKESPSPVNISSKIPSSSTKKIWIPSEKFSQYALIILFFLLLGIAGKVFLKKRSKNNLKLKLLGSLS